MNKSDVLELKRRFKKESCTISRLAGCYVNSSKEKICTFNEDFLSLKEDEFYKYLEIAKKTLSGNVGNNLIELVFPIEAEELGSPQQSLLALTKSGLEGEELILSFFDHIINTYDFVGNYLILLYYDNYDVIAKSSDNRSLDESEETYEYIICSICPVMLSKPGLGYREDEHRIGARLRDWIVAPVDSGFVFPCFSDRSSDIHSVMTYSRKPEEPHTEFWEEGLGCTSKLTASQKKDAFNNILMQTIGVDKDDTKEVIIDIQSNLNDYIEEKTEFLGKEESVTLDPEAVREILESSPVSVEKAQKITDKYEEYFKDELPDASDVLDTKVLKNNELRIDKKNLQKQVASLNNKLKESGLVDENGNSNDIVVNVNPGKLDQITTTYLDGKRCLIIPIDDGDKTTINGELQ